MEALRNPGLYVRSRFSEASGSSISRTRVYVGSHARLVCPQVSHPGVLSSDAVRLICRAQPPSFVSKRCRGPFTIIAEEQQWSSADREYEGQLKEKAKAVLQKLPGRSVFLVGMMGSGKSTIGRGLGESLGYVFFDSDKLIEEAAGGMTIAEMFQTGKEEYFRNAETEVLGQLAKMSSLVVATGGGVVIRPQNWTHMKSAGITVWLDVPLECLARRVVAVGSESRPLLAGDQVLERLTKIFGERHHMYRNADVAVSVEDLARKKGLDVDEISPTILTVQILEDIAKKYF